MICFTKQVDYIITLNYNILKGNIIITQNNINIVMIVG